VQYIYCILIKPFKSNLTAFQETFNETTIISYLILIGTLGPSDVQDNQEGVESAILMLYLFNISVNIAISVKIFGQKLYAYILRKRLIGWKPSKIEAKPNVVVIKKKESV
jgi:hypothetical protein